MQKTSFAAQSTADSVQIAHPRTYNVQIPF
jgi:hypothetical protein